MPVLTLPDISLTTAAAALSATSIRAAWVQVQAKTVNGTVRLGDALISTTRGAVLSGSQFFPTKGNSHPYDLSQIYALSSTAGDTVTVCYE